MLEFIKAATQLGRVGIAYHLFRIYGEEWVTPSAAHQLGLIRENSLAASD